MCTAECDTNPPTITCPAAVTQTIYDAQAPCTSVVTYAPATASDACGGPVVITYSHPSGSTFGKGVTLVQASAVDKYGNYASCTFAVQVSGACVAPLLSPIAEGGALAADNIAPTSTAFASVSIGSRDKTVVSRSH